MAGVAKGIIDIQINTGSAAAELKNLQRQINAFNSVLSKGNLGQGKIFSDYTKDLQKAINSSGVFTSEFVKLNSAASNLDNTLKRGRGTLGQFFSSAFNKNSASFAATMDLAARRASTLQTQFINTGASAKGMGEALAIRPLDAFSSKAAIAAERQALLNTMFRQGTTHMINFGKNVQWAGRQLMVGFTVPLTVLGTVAGKTFMDIEKQLVNLRKVYGDAFTTPEEVNQNIAQVRQLAEEYTKYGIAVKDTIGMAANAAASGARNSDLIDATRQATRLATLGQMEQQEALKTTIALQSAFRLSGEELADTINFLNMVENQTVVSLQDLSAAIPRVAPVIKGLGGDVRDMSVFLAAMQEGGVSAEQGANALKSGLASLINPTKAATETLSGFGINLDKIISANRGDLMGTVFAFGEALKGLDDFSKQQALEKVFGKYQYARLGALFENIVRDGSQASQVLQLMEYDVEALKATAEKELGAVENALGTQLIGAVERLKLSLEPIGKIFVEIAIPFVNFLTSIIEKFNGLSDGQKKFAAIAAILVGVVIPAGTMFLGLLINLLGTLGKISHGIAIFVKSLIKGGPVSAIKTLTQSTKYLSIEELEAATAAKQLASSTQIANAAMLEQATSTGIAEKAITGLIAEYRALIAVQQQAAATRPGLGVAAAAGAAAAGGGKTTPIRIRGLRRNKGGEIFMSGGTTVPGMGNTDTVPAMLTPGEFVVNKEATAKNYGLLDAINSGNKFNNGGMIPGVQYFNKFMRQRQVQQAPIRRGDAPFGQVEVNANAANARRQGALEDIASQKIRQQPVPPLATEGSRLLSGVGAITGGRGTKTLQTLQKGHISENEKGILMWLTSKQNQSSRFTSSRNQTMTGKQHAEELEMIIRQTGIHPSSLIWKSGKELGYDMSPADIKILDNMYKEIVSTFKSPKYADALFGGLKHNKNNVSFENLTQGISEKHLKTIKTTRNGKEVNLYDDLMQITSVRDTQRNRTTEVTIPEGFPAGVKKFAGTKDSLSKKQEFINEQDLAFKEYLGDYTPPKLNKGGIAGGMQYFGARMPNRVVAKSQIKKFSGTKIADSEGHSSKFQKLAGVYNVNGRKMFVKPFSTLEEAQAELIGNAARRRIAGTATPGSRIVRMDGPEGEIFATTAPMIPGMKAGSTLSTKELLKQIPASSMLGDMDATAGNILSTRGGRLLTVDPGAAGVKMTRNSKGVFRRATGSEISFGDEATNTGAYTAKAITQVIEKTGASKDFVKMLGDSIAREGLTKAQFTKMYNDSVESAIARVPAFKLPSRIGDRTKLDEAARAAGYKDADEAYSATMLRDLTSIRGLGGDIYSSASRFQGMLKANKGTLVPEFNRGGMLRIKSPEAESLISEMLLKKSKSLDIFRQEAETYGIKKSINEIISNPLYHGSKTGLEAGTTLKRIPDNKTGNLFGAEFFTTDSRNIAQSYQKLASGTPTTPVFGDGTGTLRQVSNIPKERLKILDLLEGGDSILSQDPQLFKKLHEQLSQQKIRFFDSDGTINDTGVRLSNHFQKTFSNSEQGKKLLNIQGQINKINSKEYPSGMSKNEKNLKSKLEEEAKELIKVQEKYVLDELENFKDIQNMGDILLIQEGIFGKAAMHSFGRSRADLFQNDIVLKNVATEKGYSGVAHTGGINTSKGKIDGNEKHNVVAFFNPEGIQLKNQGGTIVPGIGNTDTVPAMLTPGEFVVNKEATKNNFPLLESINSGNMQGFNSGGKVPGMQYFAKENRQRMVLPTLPGMPSRRARIMMGMSDPYQMQSRSNTGQGIFKDTSVTLSSTAKKMTETFKTISAKNMIYTSAGEKYFQAREALEKKIQSQQNIHKDRMLGVNRQLQSIGPTMAAGRDLISKSAKGMGDSIKEASGKRLEKVLDKRLAKKIDRDFGKMYDQAHKDNAKFDRNTPEGKAAAKAARSAAIQRGAGGMMMAGMIPMMASGFVDDPKQSQALMAAGGAMTLLPMLLQLGPVLGGLTLAAGALGGAFLMAKKDMDNTAKAAADFGSNLGGAANRMETVGAATGYGFASTRSAMQDFRFTEKQAEGASEIMPYFDTDEGKKLIKDMKNLSSEQRYEKVASMLTFAIADGMAPEKAESFGSAIAFALDDALLKSKVVGLIRSGTLQAGSTAMINEISKRQKAVDGMSAEEMNRQMSEEAKREGSQSLLTPGEKYAAVGALAFAGSVAAIGAAVGSGVPVLGTAIGAVVGLVAGLGYYNLVLKDQQKLVAESSKSFGSSIQTLKELNNAESLLNEERAKGLITDGQFASSQQKIVEMREVEYDRIKSAIDVGASADAQAQGIKDQLVLSGFDADIAQSVAANTTTDSVANKMFDGQDYKFLDDASKEVVDTVIAATLDGLTPENAATRVGDITDFYANMGADLVKKAEDGMLTAVELEAEFEKFQISKFATSAVENMPGYDTMSDQQRTDKATVMTDSISGAMDQVEALGISPTNLVNSLYELADPALLADITKNSDGVVKFAQVLNDLPEGWDLNIAMKYFSGQTAETDPKAFFESQKEVIDQIEELLPQGTDAMGVYNIIGETDIEGAKAAIADITSQADDLFNEISDKSIQVVFESKGYDMTKEEIDAYNALGPGESKSFVTSFIIASAELKLGEMPTAKDFPRPGSLPTAMKEYEARLEKVKELAKTLQGLNLDPSPFDDPSDGPGGGSSGPSAKDKEADRLKKLNDLLRERFELQQMAIDKDTEVYDNSIDKLNRQIELEERQVKLRQRGLEELSKKEEAVNDAYNLRVEALDKVSESNSRIGEQERSRISLASALASGDIAAAANITSEMQQQSAQYQIEDARAALEKQRQIDLDALTVSINGKLMTRKGIEFEIEQIQDRIYNKGIEIQGLQDKLRILEDQRLVIAKEREKVETRTFLMAQRQAILDLTGKNGKIPKENQQAYKDFVSSFNRIAEMYNQANPGAKVGRLNYGGSIAKMANGGITYKGSTEPPPPIMMNDGFTVPGKGMTDKVSALLTPGEFVVRKSVADKNRGFLQALNGQVFPGIGGKRGIPKNNFLEGIGSPRFSMPEAGASSIPVNNTNIVSTSSPMYNSTYNVNVNVAGTNASPDDIANVVMAKISNQNRGNLRSSRY